MQLAATEMVGDDRVDKRDRPRYEPAHPEPAQHQMGDEGSKRKAGEIVQIHTEDRIVGDSHEQPQGSNVKVVAALWVVVCLKTARPAQVRCMQIRASAAEHPRLDQIEERITGVAERDAEVAEAQAET